MLNTYMETISNTECTIKMWLLTASIVQYCINSAVRMITSTDIYCSTRRPGATQKYQHLVLDLVYSTENLCDYYFTGIKVAKNHKNLLKAIMSS